ncbi:hypothetical protein JT359_16170 [Candidatus Poribacteria bacterium]|nr:hypothetical protein [Candidatus Poribacteria bacterium]
MLIGCLFTIAGYILASLGDGTIHAQQDEQVIDKIVCRELEILDKKSTKRISLSLGDNEDTAFVTLYDKDGFINAMFYSSDHGADLTLGSQVHLSSDKLSSGLSLKSGANTIKLSTFDELGSFIWVHAKSAIEGVFQSGLEIHAHANGAHVDIEERIKLESKNNIAQIGIFNKASKKVGTFTVNDNGNGILVIGDKQGNVLGRVP